MSENARMSETTRMENATPASAHSGAAPGTALVTGASRGIGRSIAWRLAQAGYPVVINYRTGAAEAADLAEQIRAAGGRAVAIQADVRDEREVAQLFARAEQELGPIDILINNAGTALQKLLTDTSAAEWDDLFAVHPRAAYLCCRAALPGMIRRHTGSIVNISSIWGLTGASCEVAYSAAEAAVIGLTRALAREVGPSGIRVNCVAPGVIDTAMIAGLDASDRDSLAEQTPLGRIGLPDEIAGAVLYLISPDAGFVTGQIISPNGGLVI